MANGKDDSSRPKYRASDGQRVQVNVVNVNHIFINIQAPEFSTGKILR